MFSILPPWSYARGTSSQERGRGGRAYHLHLELATPTLPSHLPSTHLRLNLKIAPFSLRPSPLPIAPSPSPNANSLAHLPCIKPPSNLRCARHLHQHTSHTHSHTPTYPHQHSHKTKIRHTPPINPNGSFQPPSRPTQAPHASQPPLARPAQNDPLHPRHPALREDSQLPLHRATRLR